MAIKRKILILFLVSTTIQTILGIIDGNNQLPSIFYDQLAGLRLLFSLLLYPGYMVYKGSLDFLSWIYFFGFNAISFLIIILPLFLLINKIVTKKQKTNENQ